MRARYNVAALFVLALLLAAANLIWTAHVVNANNASQAAQNRATQAEQRRAGQIVEQKLCTTLGLLAALRPPGGSPASNPSRAYEDNLHVTLSQLGADIGCTGRRS